MIENIILVKSKAKHEKRIDLLDRKARNPRKELSIVNLFGCKVDLVNRTKMV